MIGTAGIRPKIKDPSVAEPMVTPVAVIGMACRLPGGIDSPEQLWEALLRGDDLVTEVPADRWDADEYFDAERGVPGRSVSRWGAFLDDVGGFDAAFFGLNEDKATAMDPQHRLFLETSWEAIEHAGMAPSSLAGSSTGVYLGLSHDDHTSISLDADAYGYTETAACMASGRVAYTLAVHGPALTFDTACSSGLLAVHMACRSLDGGESDLALAGGAMVMREPRKNFWASAQGMLSPTGRCRAFDEAADGFVRSEGCAVVVLKRLPDALRDGDRILAVVRGTAANSDGRTRNIATPSKDAQVAACRAALASSGVDADTIGAVEAHGTGTPVGDPIEFTSLAQTYGRTGKVLLGSAKSNFGHTESAAGALGFVKAILELQHGVVPPMVHFNRLPEALAQIETGLFVPREITPWPTDGRPGPRRMAVSSYGISGTNVHAILEQAPETDAARPEPDDTVERPMVIPMSSSSADELRRTCGRLADWLNRRPAIQGAEPFALADLGHTLARRRGHRTVRTSVIASDVEGLRKSLQDIAVADNVQFPATVGRDDRGPVWVFSGQGSQWAAMGAELLETERVFAEVVATMEPLIARESGFSVTRAMSAPETVAGIDQIQPTLFAMQVALASTMESYGVVPGAVIGHSMGEVAAAVVAGALSLPDGVRVICRRSALLKRLSGSGSMASVDLPENDVRQELASRGIGDVVVAVVASPQTHRDRWGHADGPRPRRGLGAARRDGPRSGRRRRVPLAAGRPDPRRPGRGADRSHAKGADGSLLLVGPAGPEGVAAVRSGLLGGQPPSDGPLLRGSAGSPRGRPPGLRRVVTAPAAHPRRRTDRRRTPDTGRGPGQPPARPVGTALRARLPRRSAQRRCRRGLLRAVPRRATAGRAVADMDAPPVAAPPHRGRRARTGPSRRGAPAAGSARPAVGGTRTARLAGRRRHRRPAMAE